MESISDISWRVEFIVTTLKNSATLLKLLYDVDDANLIREDINEAKYDLECILENYDKLVGHVQTQKATNNAMCKERLEFQNRIDELEEKLGIVKDSKKIGIRNVALRMFKNKQPKEEPQKIDTRAEEVLKTWMQDERYI